MNHTIKAVRNRYNDGWTSENENFYIIIPQLRNTFFGIGIADKGRAVYQGPVLENLAFLYGRAVVIDNHGGTQKDIEQNGSVEVALGDTVTFNGRTFRVEDCGDRYNANLVEVTPEGFTLEGFVTALNTKFAATGYKFAVERPGVKYTRIVQTASGQRSVFCFVDAAGNILKAAGWKAPAKGVRSTLATVSINQVDPYGSWLYYVQNRKNGGR